MLALVFFISFATSGLVSFREIDYKKDYFLLYSRDPSIIHQFSEAVHPYSIQASYIFCSNESICNFTSTSEAYISKSQSLSTYSWEYNFESFGQFLHKLSSPFFIPIKNFQDLQDFKQHNIGFLLFSNNSSEIQIFKNSFSKYHESMIFFGLCNNEKIIQNEKIEKLPMLKLYGLDGIYNYNATENFEEFLEKFSCPLLLPYSESLFVENCMKDKVTVISFINSKRKGNWNSFAGVLKMYALEFREKLDFRYQMVYVDSKINPHVAQKFNVEVVPFVMIVNRTFDHLLYLGEYNLKAKNNFFQLLEKIFQNNVDKNEFLLEKITYNKYFTIWQILPLIFLVTGLTVVGCYCVRDTLNIKRKIN